MKPLTYPLEGAEGVSIPSTWRTHGGGGGVHKILIIEDERSARYVLRQLLTPLGYQLSEASDATQARTLVREDPPDLVLLDMRLSRSSLHLDGIELLREFRTFMDTPIVIVSGVDDLEDIQSAMRHGATDYLLKPVQAEVLVPLIEGILTRVIDGSTPPGSSADPAPELERLITRDERMLQLRRFVQEVAPLDSTVLLRGGTGTGKELVARLLHDLSGRRDGPFVAVNCGAIPRDLLEAELFGSEAGAYTGAQHRRAGKFEQADGGTLFLDEVGELPLDQQTALLRVIQERQVVRLGGARPVSVDFRLVAATHQELTRSVEAGTFRQDLLYRLDVVPIHIPPLSERRGDIPLLVRHQYRQLTGTTLPVGDGVLAPLARYPWAGNVRELMNLVERSYILSQVTRSPFVDVLLSDVPPDSAPDTTDRRGESAVEPGQPSGRAREGGGDPLAGLLDRMLSQVVEGDDDLLTRVERALLVQALRRAGGNRTQAARLLGIDRKAVERRCRKFGQ